MGQYYLIVNTDKNEFIHPHSFGDGMKLGEQNKTIHFLRILIGPRKNSKDKQWSVVLNNKELIKIPYLLPGSWSGNKIVFAGEYNDDNLYNEVIENFGGKYTDISEYLYQLGGKNCKYTSSYYIGNYSSSVYYNLDKCEYYEYITDEEKFSNDDKILYSLSNNGGEWSGNRISMKISETEKVKYKKVTEFFDKY
jgi:hypothetical protein